MNQGNDNASLLDWVIELNDLDAIFKRIFQSVELQPGKLSIEIAKTRYDIKLNLTNTSIRQWQGLLQQHNRE